MKYVQLYLLGALLLCSMSVVWAHGNGASFEEERNGYFVDIGYSEPTPVEMMPLRFDFTTYATSTPGEETYTDVWVRIAQDRTLFFSGGINKPTFGPTGFTYIFPTAGEYQVTARFQNDGETMVESTFPITVAAQAPIEKPLNPYATGGVGFLVGLVLMYFIRPKSRSV